MVRRLIEAFFDIPAIWVVAAVFGIPALETALLVGFMLPGETAVLLGGVLAARGHVPIGIIVAASILGPLTGDVVGYVLGRRYGEEIVRSRLGRKWDRAHRWLEKKGGWPIFVGRFVPFVRTVLPSMAGSIRAPRLKFLAWDLSAATVWGAGTALLGYWAARNWELILKRMSIIGLLLLVAFGISVALYLRRRSRRAVAVPRPAARRRRAS
jgi:undecaprenyl-diphosphatase